MLKIFLECLLGDRRSTLMYLIALRARKTLLLSLSATWSAERVKLIYAKTLPISTFLTRQHTSRHYHFNFLNLSSSQNTKQKLFDNFISKNDHRGFFERGFPLCKKGDKNMSTNNDSSRGEPERKKSKMLKKIGTHNGTFHCDEALACFLLRLLPEYKDATIVRTRDSSKLDECDIVVDVGGVFDEKKLRFDHHQREFNESMNSLNPDYKWVTKLSSAGLIFYHFGHRIIEQILQLEQKDLSIVNTVYRKVYENFIEEIDGIDNGINQTEEEPKYIITTNISSRVKYLNPRWNEPDFDEEELFKKAMKLVGDEFTERVLFYKESWLPARERVLKALEDRKTVDESGEILLLASGSCPWKDHLLTIEEEKDITPSIKYVLYTDQAGNWRIQCVPLHHEGFTNRLSLPEEWRGLRNDTLSEKSGIKDCIFVHSSGFIGGNKTYEGVLEMATVALKQKKET